MNTSVWLRRERPAVGVPLLVLVLLVVAMGAWAQAPSDLEITASVGRDVSVRTDGGGRYQGTLIGVMDDRVEIIVADGLIVQVARDRIVEMRVLEAGRDPRALYEDSASNRLVVMPTGFPLERGEFHIASQEIIAVTASYGITDVLSVWGGISIPGALFSLRASAVVGERVGVSVGSFVGASWLDLSLGPFVLPYTVASFGEPDNNVTVGGGFGMTFSDGFSIPGFVVAVAGKRTLTATTAILTETWVAWFERDTAVGSLPAWTAVPSFIAPSVVFRIASDRLSWDLGAVVPVPIARDDYNGGRFYVTTPVIPLPVISLTYRIR